jgi:hypothetical protein
MPDGHGPVMPQVTAVDDQFGTHTISDHGQLSIMLALYGRNRSR